MPCPCPTRVRSRKSEDRCRWRAEFFRLPTSHLRPVERGRGLRQVSGQPPDGQAPDGPLSPLTRGSLQPEVPFAKRSAFARLGEVIARYHRLVVAVWVIVVVGSAVLVP